jgi:hypothetical protein
MNLNDHPFLKVKFDKNFQKVENSEFVSCSVLIAYEGENRNGSDITKEAFEKADASLGLIPIVGHWLAEKQNFGDHDSIIEWNGNELVFKDNTVPYGVVRENHNAEWVEIEEGGIKHNYRKCDAVLWYGRYQEPVQKVIDNSANQSMEINVKDYVVKDNGVYQIKEFEYSALCLLGREVDEDGKFGENNVEPCFESSSIIVSDQFKSQFNLMVDEMKKTFACDDDKDNEKEFKEEQQKTPLPLFSATVNQKREALRNELPNETKYDDDDNLISDIWYWIQDFDDEFVYVEKSIWTPNNYDCENGRFTYTFDDVAIKATIDVNSWERMILVWLTEEENQRIQDERNQYHTEIESLKLQVAELQDYKKANEFEQDKVEIENLIEQFEPQLSESEEFVQLKENIKSAFEKNEKFIEVDALNKELFAMIGRKNFTIKTNKIVSRVAITDSKTDKKTKSEFGFAEKYFKKLNDDE